MLCTQVKTHNFTDIGQKKCFQTAGGNPVIKNTYLAAIEEEKMIIYTMCIYTENYDVTAAVSNGFLILSINNISVDYLSIRARISYIYI